MMGSAGNLALYCNREPPPMASSSPRAFVRRSRLVALPIPLLILAASCGSGGNTTARSTTTTTSTTTGAPTSSTTAPPTTNRSGGPPQVASCTAIAGVPSGATAVTTAPVDFDGDNTPDTFRVYRVGTVWHARAEIANFGVNDQVVSGSGPSMTAIGGATVNNDATQEAWIKVGSGASTDIISFFVFRQCQLQRVLLNGVPAEFPIGASVTHADGLQCFGFDVGIEAFATNSTDGMTYAGNSKIYTIDLSGAAPTLVLGTTAPQSETSPPGGPAFDNLSRFGCDNLGPSIP
jgi:hypothetical protein